MKTFRFLTAVTVMLLLIGINTNAENTVPGDVTVVTGHAYLEQFVGNWTGTGLIWEGPGADPFPAAFVATSQMIVGGNFLETKVTGNIVGMPFEGLQITGYSESRDKFSVQWINDLTSSEFCISEGTLDDTGIIRTDNGECPVCEDELSMRTVTNFIDEDHYTVTTYTSGGANGPTEYKSMETTYTRNRN